MKISNQVLAIMLGVIFSFGLSGSLVAFAAGPAEVNLGAAGNFVILAKTGISNTGPSLVVGDIGVSPAAATYITGFALTLPAASAFSTSALVTGKVYAPGYANPTPTNLTTAVLDMQTAYTNASGRTNPTATELGAGNIGGMTLAPGLYKWSTGVTIPTDVTLSGSANDVWIFQIAQNLNLSSAKKIILAGGAKADNIFWVVAGQTTIGTTAVFNGNILDQTTIVLNTGAKLNGRALAQTAVTLDSNSVSIPSTETNSATPAVPVAPTVSPAIPATPATPANNNEVSPTSTNASAFGQQVRTITKSLGQGGRGNEVTVLQQFLISQNKGRAAQALANAGATSYFGSITRAALAEFQAKVGISPALGNFGPITRTYLGTHY
jgi:hypothetical protein